VQMETLVKMQKQQDEKYLWLWLHSRPISVGFY
jgi:hypothetical protein